MEPSDFRGVALFAAIGLICVAGLIGAGLVIALRLVAGFLWAPL